MFVTCKELARLFYLKWLRIESNTLKKYEEKYREEGHEESVHQKSGTWVQKGIMSLEEIAEMTELDIEDMQALEQAKASKY